MIRSAMENSPLSIACDNTVRTWISAMRRAVFELTPSRRRKHRAQWIHSEREPVDMVFVENLPGFHSVTFTVTASGLCDPMNQQLLCPNGLRCVHAKK